MFERNSFENACFFRKNIGNTVDSDIEILYNISIRYTVYKRTKVRLYAVYLNFNMRIKGGNLCES